MKIYEIILEEKNDVHKIIRMYIDGETLDSIGREFGFTRQDVFKLLKKIPNYDELRQQRQEKETRKIQQMGALYAKGESPGSLSKKFKISALHFLPKLPNYQELHQEHLKNLKINRTGPKNTTAAQIQQLAKMYAGGLSFKDMGQIVDITRGHIDNHLHSLPNYAELVQQRKKTKYELALRMAKMYADGQSPIAIARQLGVSDTTVKAYIQKLPNVEELKQLHVQNKKRLYEFIFTESKTSRQSLKEFAPGFSNGSGGDDDSEDDWVINHYDAAYEFFELFDGDTFVTEKTIRDGKVWQGFLYSDDDEEELVVVADFIYDNPEDGDESSGWGRYRKPWFLDLLGDEY